MLSNVERVLFLQGVELFADIEAAGLSSLAEVLTEKTLETNEVLVAEGDPGGTMFLIVEGEISVSRAGVEVAKNGRRDYIGEISVLDGESRTASLTATKHTVVLGLERADFHDLLAERPQMTRAVIRSLARKLRLASIETDGGVAEVRRRTFWTWKSETG